MTSHIYKQPHRGLGRNRFDQDLHWLFCESDSAVGMRSNMGGHIDMAELGVIVSSAYQEPTPNLEAAGRLRRLTWKLARLSRFHQQVLMLHYCRPGSTYWDRETGRECRLSELDVAAAHKEWRSL